MPIPANPKLLKGGVVLVDPRSLAVRRTIALQYNPDSIARGLEAQTAGEASRGRTQAARLSGPPLETIRLEAELDAADQLDKADRTAGAWGIQPQLAALEALVYPDCAQIVAQQRLANQGALEILPPEAPLALLVWSPARTVPIRVAEFSVVEQAFDARLNPIRARLTLSLRVLSVSDLGFGHRGGGLYLEYHRQKERLAALAPRTGLAALGVGSIG